MSNAIREAQRLGQAVWYDNMRRGLLNSGELKELVEMGVSGLTSNPTIFEKAVAAGNDYDDLLLRMAGADKSVDETYERLAVEDIQAVAGLLRSHYEFTKGADGFASLEVSPNLAHDTEATVQEARRLFAALDRPNVMIKVPATPEGIPAIRQLVSEGVNVNITLIFAIDMYKQVMEAYVSGLEALDKKGGDVRKIGSVASFFVSRVDTEADARLDDLVRKGKAEAAALKGKAAVANAKLAYQEFKKVFYGERFAALRKKGAHVQRPLWASTSTKNPAYPDLLYVETLIGKDTVNTMPPNTLQAFLGHGSAAETVEQGVDEARQAMADLEKTGVSMKDVTDKLTADGVKAFADSFNKLMENIREKQRQLVQSNPMSPRSATPAADLGSHYLEVELALTDMEEKDVVRRIWQKDHTVWKPDPTGITDHLGWLTVTDMMGAQAGTLTRFADEVRAAGYRHVVLLGMGGSSLAPEVLRRTFGNREGYPELLVLDTTVPAWILDAHKATDPAKTLFIVSSKSGGTIETMSLYRYFRNVVDKAVGAEKAGQNFVAVTDPGTVLEKLAREQGFRAVFLNPPDIGGRYSVLSYFGLVPAALAGVDVAGLLERAEYMRAACSSAMGPEDNSGAWLGAIVATLALEGRDKLTLLTSPSIEGFGLWVEQLVAESTGKDGAGIVPVAGEPFMDVSAYNTDRQFIILRLDGDDNAALDAMHRTLAESRHPVVRLDLKDRLDLGAEFFRWEFATAVAGCLLGVNPFDQPNVEEAKRLTGNVLKGAPQDGKSTGSFEELLAQARPSDYLAVLAYVAPSAKVEQAVQHLRQAVSGRLHVAVTFGYGPRYLHSTGQLHKGGWSNGLFLILTADHSKDAPVPDQPYTFATLADAQALGDLQALQAKERRAVRVHLGKDVVEGIKKLAKQAG